MYHIIHLILHHLEMKNTEIIFKYNLKKEGQAYRGLIFTNKLLCTSYFIGIQQDK